MKHVFLGLIWVFFSVLFYKPVLAQVALLETTEMLESVDALEIADTMKSFSEFTRYYNSPKALEAQEWLKSQWEEITQGRDDVNIGFFHHPEFSPRQPSLILAIRGSTFPEEKIVLGAHADSIMYPSKEVVERLLNEQNQQEGSSRASRINAIIESMNLYPATRAPGADDNASGIAVITEILRVLMLHDYRPTRTIMFMAYAAEEIALQGSEHIATSFAEDDQKVVGVLNFDMTNFKGSEDLDLVMVSDYTSFEQNAFLGQLIQIYLPEIKWEYDECDGECSDHASWHNAGFPASMLTEARMDQITSHIHKVTDTFEESGGNAEHSVNFVKLALVFLTEINRFGICKYDQEKCD